MTQSTTSLWTNARLATCIADASGVGEIHDGTVAVRGESIVYAGPTEQMPGGLREQASNVYDVEHAWITPGLIDCHTHLVFGGDRSFEFERRLEGATYAELQACGGGIFGTVKATREASDEALLSSARTRLLDLARSGVTTVEIKSGYGLSATDELRMLEIADLLRTDDSTPDVIPTCLAAHALPVEFENRREKFIELVINDLLPEVARRKLASSVDVFGENIAFRAHEVRQIFTAAKALGLAVKLHADQLSDQDGAAIAAQFGALSADHLEFTSTAGVQAMAQSGTVAVILPGAFYNLRETQRPPIDAMREHNVDMAVATDANPGSSPMLSLTLAMNMACVQFGLTIDEAVLGTTRHAAKALGLNDRGTLAKGQRADFCLWPVDRLAEIIYWTGSSRLPQVVQQGQLRENL